MKRQVHLWSNGYLRCLLISTIYNAEGTHDFTSIKAASRQGSVFLLALRDVAVALMNFDSGIEEYRSFLLLLNHGVVLTLVAPALRFVWVTVDETIP